MDASTKFELDKNLHTLHNRIPGVNMDTRSNGGIRLWLTGVPLKYSVICGDDETTISVHLSKDEAIMLAKEILYRVASHVSMEVQQILSKTF